MSYEIPSNYSLASILLTNFDGSEQIDLKYLTDGFVIEESLFSPAVFGQIDISDSIGLHAEFPIFGQEKITFEYTTSSTDAEGTPFPKLTREFTVYKLANKLEQGYTACSYRLMFVSTEWIMSERLRVSESYVNQASSTIVSSIFKKINSLKKFDIEETINNQRVLIPYMKPLDAINWLASYSVSVKNEHSSFLFFENSRGYQFTSIDSLLTQTPIDVYSRVQKLSAQTDKDKQDLGMDTITMNQTFDSLGSLSSGLLGSNLQTFDPITRTYRLRIFDYSVDFDKTKHIQTGLIDEVGLFKKGSPLISTQGCRKYIITPSAQNNSSYIKSKGENNFTFSKKREETLQTRLSQLLQLNQIQTTVTIPGDSRLTAGDVIVLKVPSFQSSPSEVATVDPYYTGRFLIKKVSQRFTGATFKTELVLMKDSVDATWKNVPADRKNS